MDRTLEGPTVVTRTIRPPRLAYIVKDPEHCELVIRDCSLTWGGKHFCIVPYNPSTGITEEWWRLLVAYDPDTIFSYTELDARTEEKLLDMTKLWYPRTESQSEEHIGVLNPVRHGRVIHGQSLYSVLIGVDANKRRAEFPPALVLDVPSDHPLRLYIKAMYGCLDETGMYSNLAASHFKADLKLEELIPVEHIKVEDGFLDFLIYNERIWYHGQKTRLLDYTTWGLTQNVLGPDFRRLGDRSIVYTVQHLLVVSDGISVEDFCWFWNLRAQRYLDRLFSLPIWLPKETIKERKTDIARLLPRGQRSFILSKTIPAGELQSLAQELGEHIEVATNDLDRFYASQFKLGIEDRQEVLFDRGRVRVPYPHADVIKHCDHPQHFYVDIELPEYKLPRLNVLSWGPWIAANYRVSRTGLSFSILSNKIDSYLEFVVPTPWQMLETFAEIAGYNAETSDKGRLAERIIRLIGGMDRAWLLSGRGVYKLVDQLAELRQSKEFKARLRDRVAGPGVDDPGEVVKQLMQTIASDRHERTQQNFGNLKKNLEFRSENVARDFVEWLIQKRLIFRGAEVKCPVCSTEQWLSVDRFNSRIQCTGCQEIIDIPLDVDVVQWRYHINSLYARAHEAGVIPHLLTLSLYANAVLQDSWASRKIIGYFPGVRLQAKPGKDVPFPEIEIDVAWIEDGELTIGECKTNGRELTAKEVSRYFQIATIMKCKRLVFAALDNFATLDSETSKLIEASPVPVVLLTGNELFDQYPHRSVLGENQSDEPVAYAENFEANLQRFLDWSKSIEPLDAK